MNDRKIMMIVFAIFFLAVSLFILFHFFQNQKEGYVFKRFVYADEEGFLIQPKKKRLTQGDDF